MLCCAVMLNLHFFCTHVAAGLGTYVEALVRKHDTEFNVCCSVPFNFY